MTGDLSPFLWQLKQSGVDEIFLPPLGRIDAEGDSGAIGGREEEALGDGVEDLTGEEGAGGGN